MGLHFRQAIFRYFIICAWIRNFNSAQMITQDSNSGLSSGSSYFFYQRPEFPRDCEELRQQCSFQNRSGVYLIKPDGLPEPFEVFCDNQYMSDDGGWMVILRRLDGSVNSKRTWDEYKYGYGFLGTEFWLGNDKLAYVTNQKQFELRIDMVKADGSSFYITYDNFRISDEWSGYAFTSLGEYGGSADAYITSCEKNLKFGACICQGTCDQPEATNDCDNNCVHGEGCVCPDGFLFKGNDCVPENECGCFVEGKGVIPNGDTYINTDCSSRCTCNNDVLTCENYRCSPNANCEERNNVRMCSCNDGFEGNGQICTAIGEDCLDLYNAGSRSNAVYIIHPSGWSSGGIRVYCDMTTAGGGWTVFQRRKDGGESFYRPWSIYKRGFGTLTDEFWLGNDKLHVITNQKNYQLRIDLRNAAGSSYYALYNLFRVNNEGDNYRLAGLGSYSGNAGYDAMDSRRGQPFSTYDNDNEIARVNCAEKHRGAWWYGYRDEDGIYCDGDNFCHRWTYATQYCTCSGSNLNGHWHRYNYQSVFWSSHGSNDCQLKFTEMKIRPI